MKISTKTGDAGRTKLMFGRDVSKSSQRVRAYGAVDDFSATLGLARSFAGKELGDGDLKSLEDRIESAERDGDIFSGWTHSGETHLQAALDMARARCRNAEREIVGLAESEGLARDFPLVYINRLSDYLWILAQVSLRS